MGRQKLPYSERKHRCTFCFSYETKMILEKIPNKSAFVEMLIREKLQMRGTGENPKVDDMIKKEGKYTERKRTPYGY